MPIPGSQRDILRMALKAVLFVYCVVSLVSVQLADAQHEGLPISPTLSPSTSPAISDLPLPAEFPRFHRKYFSPQQTEAPEHPPPFSRLVASVHPPTNSHFSKPSMKKNAQSPGAGLVDIAPAQSTNSALPDALTQPPLSPSISSKTVSNLIIKSTLAL